MIDRTVRAIRDLRLVATLVGAVAVLGGCEGEKTAKVQVGAAIQDPSLAAAEAEDHAPGKDEAHLPRKKAAKKR